MDAALEIFVSGYFEKSGLEDSVKSSRPKTKERITSKRMH